MPIYVDPDICDNSKDCPAASYCVPLALEFDNEKGKIAYDKSKCKSCGTCVHHCGPGAIYLAKDDEELEMLVEELNKLKEMG
ncbi:4Fe-4S binding protein [Metallumcola ferriviriculae]|uniref:4Fe-4S binding protein n=1 Tax=Metallumcola ferriviriculae TaxID=3039180 RepID=A0AAU0ULA4_9FIRM|nr:4Fe-4S binding protein [Desulfitibacteraceae bacterium MK1]